jgi:hypothetical protein
MTLLGTARFDDGRFVSVNVHDLAIVEHER